MKNTTNSNSTANQVASASIDYRLLIADYESEEQFNQLFELYGDSSYEEHSRAELQLCLNTRNACSVYEHPYDNYHHRVVMEDTDTRTVVWNDEGNYELPKVEPEDIDNDYIRDIAIVSREQASQVDEVRLEKYLRAELREARNRRNTMYSKFQVSRSRIDWNFYVKFDSQFKFFSEKLDLLHKAQKIEASEPKWYEEYLSKLEDSYVDFQQACLEANVDDFVLQKFTWQFVKSYFFKNGYELTKQLINRACVKAGVSI